MACTLAVLTLYLSVTSTQARQAGLKETENALIDPEFCMETLVGHTKTAGKPHLRELALCAAGLAREKAYKMWQKVQQSFAVDADSNVEANQCQRTYIDAAKRLKDCSQLIAGEDYMGSNARSSLAINLTDICQTHEDQAAKMRALLNRNIYFKNLCSVLVAISKTFLAIN